MKRSLLAAVVAGAVMVLGACGSSSSKSNGNGTQAISGNSTPDSSGSNSNSNSNSSKSGALCSMFSPEAVAKLFGKPAEAVKDARAGGLAKEQCVYKDANRTANTPYWL